MKLSKFLTAGAFLFMTSTLSAQENALWLRYPSISPDGTTIAFNYQGDIYTVPISGGTARQLTSNPAFDGFPIWAPDSKTIAFSSNRDGDLNVYTINTIGGVPKRITHSPASEVANTFTPDGKKILYKTTLTPDQNYSGFPTLGEQVWEIDLNGSAPKMVLPFAANSIQFNKNGNKIYYHDYKGYEDEWRKHHKSSVTRDIWVHDLTTGSFTNLTHGEVEDRYPVLSADEKTIYFLTERFGDFNVAKFSLDNPKEISQVTKFSKHPVRFLTGANNGTLSFFYNGEIYTLKPGENPQRLSANIVKDNYDKDIQYSTYRNNASEFALSPSGNEIALIIRGDVFVTSVEYGTTRRITNTAEQERSVNYSPDGLSLVYASERNGNWNLYTTSVVDTTEKSLVYAKSLVENQLTTGSTAKFQPAYSPDGKEVAFLENRTEIRVINLKSKKIRTVLPGKYNYSYSDGDQYFEWSPDSKWILAQFFEYGGWQYTDLAVVRADGSQEIHNITNSGYQDYSAHWSLDGKAIIFKSDRAGYRSHGSWGSEDDVYIMFFDIDAWNDFRLTKEEAALAKAEKQALKDAEKKKEKESNKKKEKEKTEKKEEKDTTLTLSFENLEDHTIRLTRNSANISSAILSKDGLKLYYFARFEKGYDLWVYDTKEYSTKLVAKMNGYNGGLEMSKDGKYLFTISNGQIQKIEASKGSISNVSYTAEFELKSAEERNYIFNHVWQQVVDKFYSADINGIDWAFYKKEYSRFLPYVNNNHDFAEVLGEMLGELNASHTGARYYGSNDSRQPAFLGAFFDMNHKGNGLLISEIMDKSPLLAETKIHKGVIIESIDNVAVNMEEDYTPLLAGKAGKRVLLSLRDPKTKETWTEFIKPISQWDQNSLLYTRWVRLRRELVDSLSGGKIGYIHIKGMDSPSFRTVYSDLFGRMRNKEAIIIDTRSNGGGWLHEDLAILLSGKKVAEFVPRGQYIGQDPFAQWTKPSAVVMGENNYSNAHGFPWIYKEMNIGKLIGMPVPGTMTAVWWERQQDASLVFGIPEVGMKDNKGVLLENNQLEPDIRVENTPESLIKGDDLQIKAAVEELMKEIK